MAARGSRSLFSAGCSSLGRVRAACPPFALPLPLLLRMLSSRCSLLESAGLTRSLLAQRSFGPEASVSLYSGPRASQLGPTTAASSVLRKGSGPAGIPATAGTPGGEGPSPSFCSNLFRALGRGLFLLVPWLGDNSGYKMFLGCEHFNGLDFCDKAQTCKI